MDIKSPEERSKNQGCLCGSRSCEKDSTAEKYL